MPELSRSQAAIARWSNVIPATVVFHRLIDLYTEAEDIYRNLPKRTKARVNVSEEAPELNLAMALARANPDQRREQKAELAEVVAGIDHLMQDKDFVPVGVLDEDDLDLITDFVACIQMLSGDISRQSLHQFVTAVKDDHWGVLIAEVIPPRGRRNQKVEMRYTHDLPHELRSLIGLQKRHVATVET